LSLKSGPTESGVPRPRSVGGTVLPIDKMSIVLSNFWVILVLLLLVPLGILFYKKRDVALKLFIPLIMRCFEIGRIF
jgi:hypothetical protein